MNSGEAAAERPARGAGLERMRLEVAGAVQGVGFRPFVYRLAEAERLSGFVANTAEGATIEIEGAAAPVARFFARLTRDLEPPAAIHRLRARPVEPQGDADFVVSVSGVTGTPSALVMPDLASCPDCLAEIGDPQDRRFGYPFTTCVRCGPRYSILSAVPYDRERTVMRRFAMCAACRGEYEDPASRRFHAESIACPACGPQLSAWDTRGRERATGGAALEAAAQVLRDGGIVGLKGLGGFQLLVDATREEAVQRLRDRKRRPRKPFALLCATLESIDAIAHVTEPERVLLGSREAPIVLLRAKHAARLIAPAVAPGNPWLGVMLPCTPLHHLLLRRCGLPLVATSGNLRNEPMAIDEREAVQRLGSLVDAFLVHDRPILRAVDDSVVRVMAGRETLLRRARGYAPLPISHPAVRAPMLALGGHQKNAIATGADGQIVLGPHIGDLSAPRAREACDRASRELPALRGLRATHILCDAHPDYYTSRAATRTGLPVLRVPHHLAHVMACMADNGLSAPLLGIAWDGSGWGGDGTVWGGEFLRVEQRGHARLAHLWPFALPGGEAAVREPRRAALGVLHALYGARAFEMTELAPVAAFDRGERAVLARMIERGLNTPQTSSAGRVFDAAAALLDLCQAATFDGEAGMAVEAAAERAAQPAPLPPVVLVPMEDGIRVDWRPMMRALIESLGVRSAESLAAGLHEGFAQAMVAVAERAGLARVALTGGCFQNARLTERAVVLLRAAGFEPHWHRRIPPNDGGLAAGQIAYAAAAFGLEGTASPKARAE